MDGWEVHFKALFLRRAYVTLSVRTNLKYLFLVFIRQWNFVLTKVAMGTILSGEPGPRTWSRKPGGIFGIRTPEPLITRS